MPSRNYAAYNKLRDNALHTHTQHWSIDCNRGAAEAWYAMPVCDVTIVSTISRMLHAVAAVIIIILIVRCWSWALLCCVWKLLNLSSRPVSAVKNTTVWKCRKIQIRRWEKSRFYPVLVKIQIKKSRLTEDFYKE